MCSFAILQTEQVLPAAADCCIPSGVLLGFCTSESQILLGAWQQRTSCGLVWPDAHISPLNSWDLPKSQNLFQVGLYSFLTLHQVILVWIKSARWALPHVNLYKNRKYTKTISPSLSFVLTTSLSILPFQAAWSHQCLTLQHSSKLLSQLHYMRLKRTISIHVSCAHPQLHEALKHWIFTSISDSIINLSLYAKSYFG